jgi:hypothetical protein
MRYYLRALRTLYYDLIAFFKAIWRFRHLLWGYRAYDYAIPISFLYLSLEDLYKELKEYEDLVIKPDDYDIPLRNALKALKRLAYSKHIDIAMRLSYDNHKKSFKNFLELEKQIERKDLEKVFSKEIAETIQSWWV